MEDFKLFVRVCNTPNDVRRESERFIEYLKERKYKGHMRMTFVNSMFKIKLDYGYEVHFITERDYKRWSLGRVYKFLGADDIEELFSSGQRISGGTT